MTYRSHYQCVDVHWQPRWVPWGLCRGHRCRCLSALWWLSAPQSCASFPWRSSHGAVKRHKHNTTAVVVNTVHNPETITIIATITHTAHYTQHCHYHTHSTLHTTLPLSQTQQITTLPLSQTQHITQILSLSHPQHFTHNIVTITHSTSHNIATITPTAFYTQYCHCYTHSTLHTRLSLSHTHTAHYTRDCHYHTHGTLYTISSQSNNPSMFSQKLNLFH